MIDAKTCFSERELEGILRRPLPPGAADDLALHVQECPDCGAVLDRLAAADPVVTALRSPRGRVGNALATDLIERLKGLGKLPIAPRSGVDQQTPLPQDHTENGSIPTDLPASTDDKPTSTYRVALSGDEAACLSPPESADEIGRLAHYRVLGVLGRGGMGLVFRAEDVKLRRLVALKVMLPSAAASPAARERLLREARAAAALKHDHVVGIYEVGDGPGVPYIALELLEGEPLDARLSRDRRLDPAEAVRVGREMALGLAAAHERGLIHRDVKPGNVWLEARPGGQPARVKLLDFGLARTGEVGPGLTGERCVVGTPGFMSPEQARGEAVGPATDLFALGCVLYRATTGRLAFEGADSVSTLVAVVLHDPAPPRELNPGVPAALSDLIMRLLAKDPAGRPESAQAVAEALAGIASANAVVPTAAKPRRRWPVAVAALGLVAACVLAGVVLVIRDKDGKEVARVPVPEGGSITPEVVEDGKEPKKAVPSPTTGSVPLDKLKREAIPEKELKAAGGGDKEKAPKELVAVLGESREDGPRVYRTAFTPDGGTLLAFTKVLAPKTQRLAKHYLTIWDVATGKRAKLIDLGTPLFAIALSADGKTFAYFDNNSIRVRDVSFGNVLAAFHSEEQPLGLALDEKGGVLAGVFLSSGLRLWDTRAAKELAPIKVKEADRFKRGADSQLPFTFSPDGTRLVAGVGHSTTDVTVWDVKTREAVAQKRVRMVHALAFSPDGKTLVAGGNLFRPISWETTDWQKLHQFSDLAFRHERASGLSFSADGKRIAASILRGSLEKWGPGDVVIWEAATGTEKASYHLPGVGPFCVSFSPDGRHLAVGNHDGTIYVLRLAEAKQDKGKPAVEPTPEAQRKVVDWALHQGGTVTVSGRDNSVRAVAELPVKWKLKGVRLHGLKHVTDDSLKELAGMTQLESLELGQTKVTGAGLAHLKGLTSLRELTLIAQAVTVEDLKHLKALPELRTLTFTNIRLGDTGLEALAELKQLEHVTLSGVSASDDGLKHLSGLKNLRELNLSANPGVTSKGVRHLAGLKELTHLNLSITKVDDEAAEALGGLKNLVHLDLSETKVGDATVKRLAGAKLVSLHLIETKVTGAGLAAFPELVTLNLGGSALDAAGLKEVATLKQLRLLVLANTKVTDADMKLLAGLTALQFLRLERTAVSDTGLAELHGLLRTQEIVLKDTKVTDKGVEAFRTARPNVNVVR